MDDEVYELARKSGDCYREISEKLHEHEIEVIWTVTCRLVEDLFLYERKACGEVLADKKLNSIPDLIRKVVKEEEKVVNLSGNGAANDA